MQLRVHRHPVDKSPMSGHYGRKRNVKCAASESVEVRCSFTSISVIVIRPYVPYVLHGNVLHGNMLNGNVLHGNVLHSSAVQ